MQLSFSPASPAAARPQAAPSAVAAKKAEDDAKKLQAQKDALAQLKQVATHKSDTAKSAAKEKVARLKQMLQQLRMLAASDPKHMGKMIAQLSKELAAAVKEYVQAGGSAGDLGGTDTATQSTADNTGGSQTPPAAEENDSAQAAAGEDAPADSSDQSSSDTKPEADGKTGTESKTATDAYQKMRDDLAKQAQTLAQKAAGDKDSQDFFDSVRDVKRQIKQMLDAAKAAAKRDHKTQDDDLDEADKQLKEVDRQLSSAGSESAGASGAVLNLSA